MKQVKNNTFDAESLRDIERMDMTTAKNTCLGLIEQSSTHEKKRNALIRDINKAPSSKEMSRIMWNVLLAGEGLYTTTSQWQKRYN